MLGRRSMGRGKIIVEFLSEAICAKVCRYLQGMD
jgi:hypothetical protein